MSGTLAILVFFLCFVQVSTSWAWEASGSVGADRRPARGLSETDPVARWYDSLFDPSRSSRAWMTDGFARVAGAEFMPLRNVRFGMALFRTRVGEEISYNPATLLNGNLPDTIHRGGVDVFLEWFLHRRARLSIDYAYEESFLREGPNRSKAVPLTPRHSARAALDLFLPLNMTLTPEMRHVGSRYTGSDTDNGSEKLGAYTLLDLSLSYRPEWKIRGLEDPVVTVGVGNLLNKTYDPFAYETPSGISGVRAPGLSFKAGISFRF